MEPDLSASSLSRELRCVDFDAMGNALRDMSWSTCEINPACPPPFQNAGIRCLCPQSHPIHYTWIDFTCASRHITQSVPHSIKIDATFVPSSGNRGYSRNRTFFQYIINISCCREDCVTLIQEAQILSLNEHASINHPHLGKKVP